MARSVDTIVAPATPAGTSALAVVRVSGPDARRLAAELFGAPPSPRAARLGRYRGLGGELIDELVFTFFAEPESYTGEDVLELSTHGNPFVVQKALEDLQARGCRPAEPGEFTRRAFLNGKLDLSQAEAVMDLIHARSERALAAASRLLGGALGRHLAPIADGLLGALARIEAHIDFPEEDLPPEDRAGLRRALEGAARGVAALLATQRYGEQLRDGIKVAIVGEPNAGKSSLLNRLIGRDRALVSPEPGTTRDFLEERVLLDGHCLRLIDTAGLNPNPGGLERLGIEKTFERIAEADLVLWVLDRSAPLPPPDPRLAARLVPESALAVLNKSDLPPHPAAAIPPGLSSVSVSALTGAGLDDLRSSLARLAGGFQNTAGEEGIAVNARHAGALREASEALSAALGKLETNAPAELLASDLRQALEALGDIGGRIDNERMLDKLFASFCIGK